MDGKKCIFINTPLEICLSRCDNGRKENIVKYMFNVFEPPTKEECWDEIIIFDYDKI